MRWSVMVLLLVLLGGAGIPACSSPGAAGDSALVDAFEDPGTWSPHPADGVELALTLGDGFSGQALQLDFRFSGGGYAIARRELDLELPENYVFTFKIRGEAPPNHLEFKLVDESGENVWWFVSRDLEFDRSWRELRIKRRQIGFAWGPAGGGEIRHVAAIEFAITAGQGGAGTVWIDELELHPLPAPGSAPLEPQVLASSAALGQDAAAVLDGDPDTAWSPAPTDEEPWIELDFRQAREFGGLVLDWVADRHARDYRVEIAMADQGWSTLHSVSGGNGGRDYLYLPEAEARRLRITHLRGASPQGPALAALTVQSLAWSSSREAFFEAIAGDAAPGSFPRGIAGEQSFWTVVGLPDDPREGLLSEDGALETGRGRFSLEPFLSADGELITWRDVRITQSLDRGYLPIPTVAWHHEGLELEVTAFAVGESEASALLARYRVSNRGSGEQALVFYLALRPFQVNPPSQTLNLKGGTAPIESLSRRGSWLWVNGEAALFCLTAPTAFGAVPFFGGDIVTDHLRHGALPPQQSVSDPFAAASGALAFALELPPGAQEEMSCLIPLYPGAAAFPVPDAEDPRAWVQDQLTRARRNWLGLTERVVLDLPAVASRIEETLKSQLGYILVNRAGPAIQPGSRSYARSWIRDGALTSSALLRLGHPEPVRDFIEWYAPHQYGNGKIPCVVDSRGADPVPEHDSNGEFIFLLAEYVRYTNDLDLARRHWPRVAAAASYLDSLRHERRLPEYQSAETRRFYGLLPPSISHEGYSAKPMHSYWDDLFALRGFRDAALLAGLLGLEEERRRLDAMAREFGADLAASYAAAMEYHCIDYLPGCADLGDFDPTATTIALSPVAARDILPAAALERTFELYHDFFLERREKGVFEAYTPYEIRNVGAFVRLGWPRRAHELLAYFFEHQRPAAWRQWAEVVSGEMRRPRFLGDMPHTWVGSDFIRSALDLIAYRDEAGQSLVLGAGIPESWLKEGLRVQGLPTPFGPLDFSIAAEKGEIRGIIAGELRLPTGGIILALPVIAAAEEILVNGRRVSIEPPSPLAIRSLPAELRLRLKNP